VGISTNNGVENVNELKSCRFVGQAEWSRCWSGILSRIRAIERDYTGNGNLLKRDWLLGIRIGQAPDCVEIIQAEQAGFGIAQVSDHAFPLDAAVML
jgi:hypothetical protein